MIYEYPLKVRFTLFCMDIFKYIKGILDGTVDTCFLYLYNITL